MPDRAHPRRAEEVAHRLAAVESRIAEAASVAGRRREDIVLVVVTKTWPESDVRLLHSLGVRHIGENRHPEAEVKAQACADLDITWHFIGQIQSNKAARIVRYADVVQSVDSVRVAQRLNAGAHRSQRVVDCLVQVSLDPAEARAGRGGAVGSGVEAVASAIDGADALRLRGVMGVAPLGDDAGEAYRRLTEQAGRLRSVYASATWISAGMTADFEAAIMAGATHVRVGSAILGERPALR